jgi:hypothetical protein
VWALCRAATSRPASILVRSGSDLDFPGKPAHEAVGVLDIGGLSGGPPAGGIHQFAVALELPAHVIDDLTIMRSIHLSIMMYSDVR